MKLGVFSVLFQQLAFESMLDKVVSYGLDTVEIGTGGYPGAAHCNPGVLLQDKSAQRRFTESLKKSHLMISAFSCHGNPLHPDPDIAARDHHAFIQTLQLAHEVEVDRICLFSGCPGEGPGARMPNWVTCAWPPEYPQILKWQWEDQAIPYWRKAVAEARKYGITKLAFEMHPGFLVYNPETLLALRSAVGPEIGANFDPSHLWWQGIDPVAAIHRLGGEKAIFHFHAKDVNMDDNNCKIKGVLDTAPYTDLAKRSWTFRTVGYGHGEDAWKAIISALRIQGYDYVLSIEHEDPLASIEEGFEKAVRFLQPILLKETPTAIWWA
jgi:sugar phosphate isomerase/epimerase